MFIDGAWQSGDGRDTGSVFEPAAGAVIAEVPLAWLTDLEPRCTPLIGACRVARYPIEDRARVLHETARLMRERIDAIAMLLTLEQGKILAEAPAEFAGSAQLFDWYAEEAKRAYGRVLVRPSGERSIVPKQPVGMIGINSFAISVADAPFGGVKLSGFRSEGGTEGFDSYCVTRAIHQA